LVALVGAVLALVGFYATSGARNSGGDDNGSDVATPKSQSKPEVNSASTKSSNSDSSKSSPNATKSEPVDDSSKTSKSSSSGASDSESASAGVPAGVARALARDRTVVLFFRQRGSADDDATARAVASVRGRRGVAVFSAPVARLDDYAVFTGSLSIAQAPAVVIVSKGDKARLIEGYIDRETLAQELADTR
jgi:hypothetical protein